MPPGRLTVHPANAAINARLRDPAVQQQHAAVLGALYSHLALAGGVNTAQAHALAAQAGFTGPSSLDNWSQDNIETLQSVVNGSDSDSDSTMEFSDGTDIEGDFTDVEGGGAGVSFKEQYNKKYGFRKGTSHSLKDISQTTGYPMKGLQTIYNKGVGAYKTNPQSVRPQVKSKEQWAMARVYAAINPKSKAYKIDQIHLKRPPQQSGRGQMPSKRNPYRNADGSLKAGFIVDTSCPSHYATDAGCHTFTGSGADAGTFQDSFIGAGSALALQLGLEQVQPGYRVFDNLAYR